MNDDNTKPQPGESLTAFIKRRAKVYEDFYKQQELLLLYGRNDPRLAAEFLAEWDKTPPPLARVRWDPTHPDHSDYCDCLDDKR